MAIRLTKIGGASLLGVAAIAATGIGVAHYAPAPPSADASSHREAPLIAEDPTGDNTDVYAFRDKNNTSKVTVIANWLPAEDTAAGPTYYNFSASARYHIKIDNTGDGRADLNYRFKFSKPGSRLFLNGTSQRYTVTRINTRTGTEKIIGRGRTPLNYVGPRTNSGPFSTGNCDAACYRRQAASRVITLPTRETIFAGQREDAFFGDIGAIFDNLAIRRGTGTQGGGKDFFAGYAVHTISMQLPIKKIVRKGRPTVGVWATTERQRITISRTGRATKRWVQVSRLANPLFNELIVPTTLKDTWNARFPHQDRSFVQFTQTPLLAKAINTFYPGKFNAPETNRRDLTAIFLTGLPKLNFTGTVKADLLRLNTSIMPSAKENRLGVLGGDNAGFPNGRRLNDDVIDIAERAVAGATFTPPNPKANNIGDGVDTNDRPSLSVFPYQNDPFSGFDNVKGQQKP